jgi:hypothetical protein
LPTYLPHFFNNVRRNTDIFFFGLIQIIFGYFYLWIELLGIPRENPLTWCKLSPWQTLSHVVLSYTNTVIQSIAGAFINWIKCNADPEKTHWPYASPWQTLSHVVLSSTNTVIWLIAATTSPYFYVPSHQLNKMQCQFHLFTHIHEHKSKYRYIALSSTNMVIRSIDQSQPQHPHVFMFLLIQCQIHFFIYTHEHLSKYIERLIYLYIYIESQFKHFSWKLYIQSNSFV